MGYLDQGVPMESSKKRKTRGEGLSVAETLAEWRDYNAQLQSSGGDVKRTRKLSKGPEKGCMKGKGGPANSGCTSLVETDVKDESTAMPSASSLVKDESIGDSGWKELLAFSEYELFDDAELMALLKDIPPDFTDSVLDFGFDVNQLGFPDIKVDMPSLADTEGKDELVNEYFDVG